ncbi:MAG: hypothetical protein F2923_00750 [Actinobacteria bacterium]|uniref:Unannotated protein n=1 Tax=freshwater metagenome TaxID=449393 RepID=A0A6J7RZC8_9ZZZZ|nr:hypothetical protein [Actinomycetota bacterium]MTB27149.1 hypothetical protein [Actinomycetota bacterium]
MKQAYNCLMSVQLYLSSQGLGDAPESLRLLNPGATQALIILNALDSYPFSRQGAFTNESAELVALGYECKELDLRLYFVDNIDEEAGEVRSSRTKRAERAEIGEQIELVERLCRADLVWIAGGNTFVLARAMKQSGFKAALLQANLERELAQLPSLIYGGYSAGAVVVGPDLQGIHLMDDPNVVPAGYDPATEVLTLGFIQDRIIPHYQSDNPESGQADKAVAFLESGNLKYRTLSDGEVLITQNEL